MKLLQRKPGEGWLRSFLREEHGFTGAEKALVLCVGLGVVGTAGFLVNQGSGKAAGDAARVLRDQSGTVSLGQTVHPLQAVAMASAPGAAAPAPAGLERFSSDFAAPRPAAPAPAAPAPASPALAVTITAAELERIVPTMSHAKAEAYAGPINQAMQQYGINTKAREAAFLGQIAEETDGFNTLTEYASGAEYNGRCKDLGNCSPGDGQRYKGRGAIQLTGKANYERAGKAFGLDLVNHPELAAQPDVAFKIAGWYWDNHGLNALADKGDFRDITTRINGGQNGEATRVLYWTRAKNLGI
jgi:predicted chitinase